jgi:DHA2 family multidrug resistance protein
MLAITVAAVQFILDRGERLDWLSSTTIVLLCFLAASALWVFIVNSLTSPIPFVDPGLFRDRNYLSGVVLRVLFGAMLFGSLVLVPPFLQNLGGYPLLDSGILMAPRGAGAMFAALFLGRLLKIIDPRMVIAFGMIVAASTMWLFSTFTEDIDATTVIMVHFIQGIAFSSFIIPVNSIAFSTISPEQRDVGTAFYALLNNIGRSLGIAFLASYLARNTQVNHAILSEHITPFNDAFRHLGLPDVLSFSDPAGLMAVNRLVTQQAELLSYIIDFQLLTAIILFCLPVIFLMRNPLRPRRAASIAG